MLGDSVRRIGGNTQYSDPEFLGCGHVDVVEACAAQQDQLDAAFGQALDYRAGSFIVDEDADRVIAVGKVGGFSSKPAAEVLDVDVVCAFTLVPGQLAEENAVIVFRSVEGDLQDSGLFVLGSDILENFLDLLKGVLFIGSFQCELNNRSFCCMKLENLEYVFAGCLIAIALKRYGTFQICAGLSQQSSGNGGLGIFLAILAALTYAWCIMATETVSKDADPMAIGIVQLGVMGVLSALIALPMGGVELPHTGEEWVMLLMLVLVCSCFGFAFQPLGQKYLPAEEAAVLTVINPLTASVMGILIAGESMSVAKCVGYVLILSALALYNMREKQRA